MINLVSDAPQNATLELSTASLEDDIGPLKKNIDDIFLIFNGILVAFMQVGFACLEVGAIKTKNATNIMMKNLCDMFIALVAYYLIGFPIAYGHGGNGFMGLSGWLDVGIPNSSKAHWFFQFVFSATASTIVSGAVAERCHFVTYIVYTASISGFVYPVVSHWVWADDGWLKVLGFEDFAGSGTVHALAGVCSFIAAAFLGPRHGRFFNGDPMPMPGHNLIFVGIGAIIIFIGFLAFNAGSLGHISQPGDSGIVAITVINTIAGGSGALLVALVLGHKFGFGPWPFSPAANAILAGVVSVCGGADTFAVWGALLTGSLGGLAYFGLAWLTVLLKVDDPLEAMPVHFGGGAIGVLMRPILSYGNGVVYRCSKESLTRLFHNIVGILVIIAWSAICSFIIFGFMKAIKKLRISVEDEITGLDIVVHGETCYAPQAWSLPALRHRDSCGTEPHGNRKKNSFGNIIFTPVQDQLLKDINRTLL